MSNNKILNIAIVGLGSIGKRHITAIDEVNNINLCGVVDLDLQAEIFCKSKKLPYFNNLKTLTNEFHIDGVIISTPTILHFGIAVEALNLGLDILIEKPISATVKEALEIISVAKKQGCKVLVAHQRRFYPLVLKTKEIINSKEIGQIIGLSGIWGLKKDIEYFSPSWRKEISAGPVITNLIHEIDCLRFIFGEIKAVSSFSSNSVRGFKKEDIVSVNLKFKNKILGNFLITDSGSSPWSWETDLGENISLPKLGENSVRIIGTEGSLEFPNIKLWSYKNKKINNDWKDDIFKEDISSLEVDPYVAQLLHFKDVVFRKTEPITNAEDAMETLKVALSILDSADNNKIINI